MHRFADRTAQPPMSPADQPYFKALGQRIARARSAADLTQVQLAEALGISQPQLAFYELGKRRVPVSMLPGLARVLSMPIEALIGDTDGRDPTTPVTQRRTRRGPVSKLEQQLDAIARLPKARQRFVSQMLDTVLAQHAGEPRRQIGEDHCDHLRGQPSAAPLAKPFSSSLNRHWRRARPHRFPPSKPYGFGRRGWAARADRQARRFEAGCTRRAVMQWRTGEAGCSTPRRA